MEELLQKVILILAVAAGGEGAIEFLFSPVLDLILEEGKEKVRTVCFNFASALLGVCLAFGFDLGVVSLLGGVDQFGWLDRAFTGVLIGRGSNWMHAFFKKFMVSIEEKLADIRMNESFAAEK